MKRYGAVIALRPEKISEYQRLHAAVWPGVLATIHKCNIRNYTIYLREMPDRKHYLFSHFEYIGKDFAGDMATMAADPTTQSWWDLCKPCQEPLENRGSGEWWAGMAEIFHCD